MKKPEFERKFVRSANEEPSSWLGEITPRGVGRTAGSDGAARLTSAASADRMRRVMLSQEMGSRRLHTSSAFRRAQDG
jgi:hypothetical protein